MTGRFIHVIDSRLLQPKIYDLDDQQKAALN